MPFSDVPNTVDFVAQEHETLKFWADTDAFNKLRALRAGGPRFGFTDGPITANNPMGVHHAWGRTYKDLFLRYKAMQGFDQRWQNGFDCQGLWVEVNVEKELGFKSKRDIEDVRSGRVRQALQAASAEICGRADRPVDPAGLLDGLERPRHAATLA